MGRGSQWSSGRGQVGNDADTFRHGKPRRGSGVEGTTLHPTQESSLLYTAYGALGPKAQKKLRGLPVGGKWGKEVE